MNTVKEDVQNKKGLSLSKAEIINNADEGVEVDFFPVRVWPILKP